MKKGLSIIALASFFTLGNAAQAQSGLSRADKAYDNYAYIDAIDLYERIIKQGRANAEILQNTGNAYYFNAEYARANEYYSQLFANHADQVSQPEYYYRYAQTLKNTGREAEAEKYLQEFARSLPQSSRADLVRSDAAHKAEIQKNSGRYTDFRNLEINSPYADYGSSVHGNELLFTTARDTGGLSKKEHTWTGAAFTKLYSATIHEDGSTSKPGGLSKKLDSKVNESTPVLTRDGSTIYFTRNNYNGRRGYDAEKTTRLKIYKSQKDRNGKWSTPESLSINSDAYSTAHPVLSPDEGTLYFVSDRPGGYGASDIWSVAIRPDGQLSTPVNLGSQINTDGRETFPFVSEDGILYFATDGRPGLGGLDVYAAKIKTDGTFTDAQNLGTPVNTQYDDFGYIISSQNRGFVSSNRPGGKGNDDIYGFTQTRALILECLQDLKITVIDGKTGSLLRDALVTIFNSDYSTGNNEFECGATYRAKAEKEGYLTREITVTLPDESGTTERQIVLEPKKVEVKKGDDLFKILKLNPIYFDYDKDNIRPDAAFELSKIVEVMKDYPKMQIDVRSHTDSRGSDSYNLKLSERRARSTAEWIMAQGIDRSRLTWKGYGEAQLINECTNGVKCTDEKHEENRRSEFIIVEM